MGIPRTPSPELCLSYPDLAPGPGWQQSASPTTGRCSVAEVKALDCRHSLPGLRQKYQVKLHCLGGPELCGLSKYWSNFQSDLGLPSSLAAAKLQTPAFNRYLQGMTITPSNFRRKPYSRVFCY